MENKGPPQPSYAHPGQSPQGLPYRGCSCTAAADVCCVRHYFRSPRRSYMRDWLAHAVFGQGAARSPCVPNGLVGGPVNARRAHTSQHTVRQLFYAHAPAVFGRSLIRSRQRRWCAGVSCVRSSADRSSCKSDRCVAMSARSGSISATSDVCGLMDLLLQRLRCWCWVRATAPARRTGCVCAPNSGARVLSGGTHVLLPGAPQTAKLAFTDPV